MYAPFCPNRTDSIFPAVQVFPHESDIVHSGPAPAAVFRNRHFRKGAFGDFLRIPNAGVKYGVFRAAPQPRFALLLCAYGCDQSNLIAIMQEIQGEYKYLSEGALTLIAEKLGISTAKVYSVATFYENFSLEAKGRHIIKVCTGTACHVRKSGPIYDSLRDALGLTGKRKTSADGLFTLETVACLGACGLAPVMTIDGEVHAKMTPEDALALVEDIRRKEAATA